MMNRLRQWMYGRYGNDELSLFMWVVSLVFLVASAVLSSFAKTEVLRYVSFGIRVLGLGETAEPLGAFLEKLAE